MTDHLTDRNFKTWQELYQACTPTEREEIVTSLADRLDLKRQSVFDLCKANPKHLNNLQVSTLRDISSMALVEAEAMIMTACPELFEVVSALVSLIAFSNAQEEPTTNDLQDTIKDIRAVWEKAAIFYADRDPQTRAVAVGLSTLPTAAPGIDSRPHLETITAEPTATRKPKQARVDPTARRTVSTETKER